MTILDKIAKRIQETRKSKGITQQQLAKIVGINQGHLSRLERGQKGANIETIAAIADVLEVPVGYLYGDSTDKNVGDRKNED